MVDISTDGVDANFPFVYGRCHLKRSMPFLRTVVAIWNGRCHFGRTVVAIWNGRCHFSWRSLEKWHRPFQMATTVYEREIGGVDRHYTKHDPTALGMNIDWIWRNCFSQHITCTFTFQFLLFKHGESKHDCIRASCYFLTGTWEFAVVTNPTNVLRVRNAITNHRIWKHT